MEAEQYTLNADCWFDIDVTADATPIRQAHPSTR
jgi:hypothetical protein